MSRFAVTVLVLLGAGIWALILAHNGWAVPVSFFAPLSAVVSVLVGALFVFNAWAWSWPIVSSLVHRPDLRGTWKGIIKPNTHSSNTNVSSRGVDVYVVIRQTFSMVHVRLLSPESQSFSLAASLFEEAPEQFALTWIYRNEPRHLVTQRSPVHHGSGILRVGDAKAVAMSGHYWTDRNTSGEISLTLLSRARVNDYDSALTMLLLSVRNESA